MDTHRRAAIDLLQIFDAAKIARQGLRRAAELNDWLEAIAKGQLLVTPAPPTPVAHSGAEEGEGHHG